LFLIMLFTLVQVMGIFML